MSVGISMVSPESPWVEGFGLVSPEEPWLEGFGDFDVDSWDSFEGVDGCGCALGAVGEGKFPWGAVVGGGVGLAAGIGLALLAKKYLFKR